ncbi:MAG: putative esterase [Anaerolineaceae bacterium]|nr:MAG: putative esterase [Anaerolineaceae bacterium]
MPSLRSRLVTLYFRIKRAFTPPFSGELDVAKERADTEAMAKQFGHFSGADCTPVTAGGVPAEWIVPEGVTTQRCILCLHGGSFFAGSISTHRSLAANIAAAAGVRALLIDYRLAPEHPFPAGPQDSLAAYLWLLEQGISPESIVIVGDSAGGALVVGLLVTLREQGQPMPAALVLLSPALDLTLDGETWKKNAKSDATLDFAKEKAAVDLYLNGADPRHPLASPLYADLHGLPPTLVQIGSAEVLLSDCTRFAEKAKSAGVDVTLEIWDGMQHEWQFAVGIFPEAKRAVERIGEFIRQRFE